MDPKALKQFHLMPYKSKHEINKDPDPLTSTYEHKLKEENDVHAFIKAKYAWKYNQHILLFMNVDEFISVTHFLTSY